MQAYSAEGCISEFGRVLFRATSVSEWACPLAHARGSEVRRFTQNLKCTRAEERNSADTQDRTRIGRIFTIF
jgi:hypothetical protein